MNDRTPAEPASRLYLEDLTVGDTFVTDTRLVDESQIVAFAEEFDPQPFHLDDRAAKDSFFGGLAASGWHTAAVTMGLLVTSGLPFANGIIGAGGEITWPSATRPGDVLHVESTIEAITPSRSKPDRAIVTVRNETLTEAREVREVLVAKLLVFRRPTGPALS
ncbi:MAG: MaoC family dehydratase [Microbacteriaceae bacterium]